jgi:small conductance mechanosensitive channel
MERLNAMFTRYAWAENLIDRGLRVLVIIAVVFACAKLIHIICKRVLAAGANKTKNLAGSDATEHTKRVATVVKLVDTSLRVILYSAAVLMVLREIGLDITPLLTGAGIAGVAVGFGAQSLVKDVISGFFILIEDQIRVGDVIKVNNGLAGSVERMELRVLALRDADGTLHIIPNGEVKAVSNMTHGFAGVVVDVHVPYQVDLKSLNKALDGVARDLENDPRWKGDLRSQPEFIGITRFEPDHMVVQLTAKVEPHSRWSVAREIRRRIILALDGEDIRLPATAPTARLPSVTS